MDAREARIQLLEEHRRLRLLVAAADEAAAILLAGRGDGSVFRVALAELRVALASHNDSEEALLEPLLAGADAWGPVRVRRMLEEHVAEHLAMRTTLQGDDVEVAPRMAELAEDLLAHIEAEERTFLHASVLRERAK
jgi:hypothetical protein